jgi:hypothetical protein
MSSNTVKLNYIIKRGRKQLSEKLENINGDEQTRREVYKLEELYTKQVKLKNHIVFLTRCKTMQIIPNGMKLPSFIKQFGNHNKIKKLTRETEERLLKTILNINYEKIKKVDEDIRLSRIQIREGTPNHWNEINGILLTSRNNKEASIKMSQRHKFETLAQEKMSQLIPTTTTTDAQPAFQPQPGIKNLSNHQLSLYEEKLLQLGLSFALKPRDLRIPMIDTAAAIELKMCFEKEEDLSEHKKNKIRTAVSHLMKTNITKTNYQNKWESWICKASKSLQQNKDIVIGKADKGNCVVIMNKPDYEIKMQDMINTGPYKLLTSDPTESYSKKVEDLCKKLILQNNITKSTAEKLIIKEPRSPIIYGAPKIHKENCPLRPIVDFRRSPTYEVAKYLTPFLKKLAQGHKYSTKNSTEFVEEIQKIKMRPGDIKVSFDVKSLFTTVPIPESLDYIHQKLEENYEEIPNQLTKSNIMELLQVCLSSTYFQYRDQYYYQKSGTAMGSPISAIVAELFLQMLEMKCIDSMSCILFWRRYVDDCFAIARARKIQEILTKINNFHPDIEFTLEVEEDGKISFLDIMLYEKEDRSIGHYVYRKPTQTNTYLNYNSFHPNAHKISVIDTLLSRAIKLCDNEHINQEIEYVTNVLVSNLYPRNVIIERLQTVKLRITNPKPKRMNEKRIILPFAGEITTKIAQLIRRSLGWEIGFTPGQKISTLVNNMKQKSPKIQRGVYSFQCEDCHIPYIGETGRDIKIRFIEHMNDIRKINIKSPVALHIAETNHHIDHSSLKLLMPEQRTFFRKFKEGLVIRSIDNKMNSSKGKNINSIWCSTLVDFLLFDGIT